MFVGVGPLSLQAKVTLRSDAQQGFRMTSCRDNRERDRKDHYLPRGFLKGFIDPANKGLAKPLWHFDLETAEWSRESPGSIG